MEMAINRTFKLLPEGKSYHFSYPKEVLKRDGPRVFKAGTFVYGSPQSERSNYERSLKDICGRLISNARFDPDGKCGPGLYANIEFYESVHSLINQNIPLTIRCDSVGVLEEDGTTVREILQIADISLALNLET